MSTSTPLDIAEKTTSHPRYDAYKDSSMEWLGAIPESWQVARLRFLLDTSPSKGEAKSKDPETEVSFVPMESVAEGGGLDLSETKPLENVVDGYTYFRDGDVLVAKITPCFENKKGALASDLTNGIGFGTTELHVLRPGPHLDSRFLFYSTMSHPFRKIGESTMYGAGGQKRVSDDFIQNLRWPIPSFPEQRAIAAYLDRETERIDALVAKKERLIELLEEKRTALISHAVTKGLDENAEMKDSGVEWIGKIPAKWDTVKLKWATSKIGSGVTPKGGSEAYVDEGITFLRSQNIHFDGLRLDDVAYIDEKTDSEMAGSRVKPHDVLLNITGASLGRCALVPSDFPQANVNQHVCIIRVEGDKLQPAFLSQVLASDVGQQQIFAEEDGASREAITFAEIGDFVMPRPPREEQERIADYTAAQSNRIYALIDRIHDGIDRVKEYRTALISAAVTGQIDVRGMA